jgi:thiol-disulfide isomerase/thioredoxin
MAVTRISREALDSLLKGEIKENATFVLKFYSNNCHLCHTLREYYVDISEKDEYKDLHFFAYNIDDYPEIEKHLRFKGVPTIFVVHANIGNRRPRMALLPEPENPNDSTWYKSSDICNFLNREAL